VLLELEGVAVDPLTGAGHRLPDAVQPLLEPGAPALEDLQPGGGVRPPEEREVDVEALVLPRRRSGVPDQGLEPLLALCRELVDDPGAAAGQRGDAWLGGTRFLDPAATEQRLEAGVERSVRERPEG